MAWCIVKKKKGPEITFGLAFKNVNHSVSLCKQLLGAKIPIAVLASFEDNLSLSENSDRSQ